MQKVVAEGEDDERAVIICDNCGTEYPVAHEYDPKRPVPQSIYVPDDFTVNEDGTESCQWCTAKRLQEQELLDSEVQPTGRRVRVGG